MSEENGTPEQKLEAGVVTQLLITLDQNGHVKAQSVGPIGMVLGIIELGKMALIQKNQQAQSSGIIVPKPNDIRINL